MEAQNKTTIIGAVIGAVAVIAAALIGAPWWRHPSAPTQPFVIAGVVEDQISRAAIGQATISLSGRTETYVTDDLGNFRIELRGSADQNHMMRIRIAKKGYQPYDEAVSPPVENLVILLQRL